MAFTVEVSWTTLFCDCPTDCFFLERGRACLSQNGIGFSRTVPSAAVALHARETIGQSPYLQFLAKQRLNLFLKGK